MKKKLVIYIGIGIVVAAALAMYFLFIAPADWQHGVSSAATGVDADGNPWIGAKNPKLIIHEFLDYECPHCSAAHKYIRSRIARDFDTIRLVRHDYARSRCVMQLGTKKIKRCPLVRAAACAAEHLPYWEWNDAVISNPRHETQMEREEYIEYMRKQFDLPKAEFYECYESDETAEKAQKIYDLTRAAKVSVTPTYMIDGKIYNAQELADFLSNR
ncbi:MAG: thioredoxin domain-containing protein [Deltaproteobacteria bacterium]|nr:thioredoxin domain-containing protein [Deltaproteobacteria bacterium]MBN2673734.1 thioredoxin domain-containing protein [Deltaproteobacteria bacterium]